MADYYIQNATVFNPVIRQWTGQDILVSQGRIAQAASHISPPEGAVTIHASGRYVSPGWVDAHVHTYTRSGAIGLDSDRFLSQGVTCVADAGTTGPGNFEDYLEHCSQNKKIQQKAYLNLAYMGVMKQYGELTDLSRVDMKACQETAEKYPDEILGMKLRIDPRVCEDSRKAMELVRRLCDMIGRPLVVHASRTDLPLEDILSFMKKGDVFAHSFAAKSPGLLDKDGNVKEAVWQARQRGVYFDLSHGKSNFSFAVARNAISQGFLPDAISTDLHEGSLKNVESLALTMSKMLACGLELEKVLQLVTTEPVRMLQLSGKAVEIREGARADLTVFDVQESQIELEDSDGERLMGNKLIKPYCTILEQDIYPAW